jgi:hypothetical protein
LQAQRNSHMWCCDFYLHKTANCHCGKGCVTSHLQPILAHKLCKTRAENNKPLS